MHFRSFSMRTLSLIVAFGLSATLLDAQTILPYETDFEATEGAIAGATEFAPWSFLEGAEITDADLASGQQSVLLPGGLEGVGVLMHFAPEGGTQFVDFYLKPSATEIADLPETLNEDTSVAVAFVKGSTEGEVYVLDGAPAQAVWIPTGKKLTLDAVGTATGWLRYTFRIDYTLKTWDLYLDSALIATDLGFYNPAIEALQKFGIGNESDAPAGLDFFYAGSDNPLFADTDKDGIPDVYETAQGLNSSANDRYGDADFDSVINLEEYMRGLMAGNPDTDGDGVPDGWELLDGTDPLVDDGFTLSELPFFDGFESYSDVSELASGNWRVSDLSLVRFDGSNPFEGYQSLTLTPGEEQELILDNPFVSAAGSTVWLDFYLIPGRYAEEEAPLLDARTSAGFYFDEEGSLIAYDGLLQSWSSLTEPSDLDEWQRLTVRLDYGGQQWAVWHNSVRAAEMLGFANPVPYFTRLRVQQTPGELEAQLDAVRVSYGEPAELDNDGDGVTNFRKANLGTDPEIADEHG